jgi:acetyltransferase-like isoleucine patch superfamily enzyme
VLNWLGILLVRYKLNQARKQGLQIGDNCRITGVPNFGSEPYLISIGNRVGIASRVTFITHDGGASFLCPRDPENKDVIKYGRITIHDDCGIGYGAIILPGVSIGPNSMVGAGAVVVRDVPPNTLVGGNMARFMMSTEDYMKSCIANNPNYDLENYRTNKMAELLRLYPYPW